MGSDSKSKAPLETEPMDADSSAAKTRQLHEQELECRSCRQRFGGQEVAAHLKQERSDEVHFVCPACGADHHVDVRPSAGLGDQPQVTVLGSNRS